MKKTRILIAVTVILIALAIVVLINHRDRQIFVSITEMKACVVDSDCVPVGCNCWAAEAMGFHNATGSELELTIPISSQSDYHYSYELDSGTYRYVITYVTRQGLQIIYSPEFDVYA